MATPSRHYVVTVSIEEVTEATPETNTHARGVVSGTPRRVRDMARVVTSSDDLATAINRATSVLRIHVPEPDATPLD